NIYSISFFFFFSSRRRHTRWPRDWSSDVCSSDLRLVGTRSGLISRSSFIGTGSDPPALRHFSTELPQCEQVHVKASQARWSQTRSEERRVGKESRTRGETKR